MIGKLYIGLRFGVAFVLKYALRLLVIRAFVIFMWMLLMASVWRGSLTFGIKIGMCRPAFTTLKSRVLADAYRFSDTKFKQIWCTNNVICSKSGAHVEFEY